MAPPISFIPQIRFQLYIIISIYQPYIICYYCNSFKDFRINPLYFTYLSIRYGQGHQAAQEVNGAQQTREMP